MLRFGLKPSAVYFNPTERCNLNCAYCYIPEKMRRKGQHMSRERLLEALAILKRYFRTTVPKGSLPQIVFHGAEPLLNREAVFAGIEQFADDFRFGVQTNATLLDDSAIAFLREHDVSIGISLDAPTAAIADRTRSNWEGRGVYRQVVEAMDRLKGYPGWSVICTVSQENLRHLTKLVDFLHEHEVPTCLMNILRCTLPRSRNVKPDDASAAKYFLQALDRTHELYQKTGRKLIVGNFANILLAIVAPAARRLMCDISPCGGGRCFFALAPNGDLFPCSEFIGLPSFCGGNLFRDDLPARARERAVPAGHRPQGRGDRSLPALRDPALLRLALSGRGPRDERRHAAGRRLLRILRRAGPLRLPPDRRREGRRLSLGRLGQGHAADVCHELTLATDRSSPAEFCGVRVRQDFMAVLPTALPRAGPSVRPNATAPMPLVVNRRCQKGEAWLGRECYNT